MNYYEHHIGDYDASTTHLTWAEDLAYTRLVRLYCRKELPIPVDLADACRLIRATSREQKAAVESVLREFFVLQADGWHHTRYDDAIARYRAGEPEREAKKANEDTRLRRHREERADLFGKLTAAGLHAPWNVAIGELRSMVQALPSTSKATHSELSPATKPAKPATPATALATPATATQEPIANSQEPVTKVIQGESTQTPDLSEVPAEILADYIAVRKAKKSSPLNCTAVAGLRREAALAGLTLTEALTACIENDWRGFKADWYANLTRQQPSGSSQNSHHGPMSDADRIAANARADREAKRMLFGRMPDAQREALNDEAIAEAKRRLFGTKPGGDAIDADAMLVEPGRQNDFFQQPRISGQQAPEQRGQSVGRWAADKPPIGRSRSMHSGFEQQNYQDGINEDGSIAA